MAHELYNFGNGDASMAYVGQTPWHGLGQKIDHGQPLEVWAKTAHLDWNIKEAAPTFIPEGAEAPSVFPNRKILYRSDDGAPLSIVSDRFKTVQPIQILEFFRDLIESGNFEMHTAGSLMGGQRIWALANIKQTVNLLGVDRINGYLLLATGCDGKLATTAQFTSVRVVCNNTLQFAVNRGENKTEPRIKVLHKTIFNAAKIKEDLGLAEKSFELFASNVETLATKKISDADAIQFILDRYKSDADMVTALDVKGHVKNVFQLFKDGKGSDLITAKGTTWGLVNAFTEYLDHSVRSHNTDNRLNHAWFGKNADLKEEVFTEAMKIAA